MPSHLILGQRDEIFQLFIHLIKLLRQHLPIDVVESGGDFILVLEEYLTELHGHCLIDSPVSARPHVEHTELVLGYLAVKLDQIFQFVL